MTEYTFEEFHWGGPCERAYTRVYVISETGYRLEYIGTKRRKKTGTCLPDMPADYTDWEDFHECTDYEFETWVEDYDEDYRRELFSDWLRKKNSPTSSTLKRSNGVDQLTIDKLIKAKEMLEVDWTKYVNKQISLVPYIYGTTAQNKENNMFRTNATPEDDARQHLFFRAKNVKANAIDKAREDFHINHDPAPKTRKELAERLANNMFVIDGLEEYGTDHIWDPLHFLTWRNPAVPADEVGYKAKCKEITKDYDQVVDAIYVKTPAEALVDFEAFATKYTQ